ncbi:neural-cadherin [Latimeria chalumnae]|uniref:neural-cadherin n=1 Tax=Latimeria chalumnae TaxID=7897 RepID=UPI00313D41F2
MVPALSSMTVWQEKDVVCRMYETINARFHHILPDCRKDWYLMRIELIVTDVNDNAPEWTMSPFPFLAVVSPDATAGTTVYTLLAQDGDEGISGEVEYFLLEGGDDRFEVDKKTGVIRTTGLPLEKDKEYLLTVLVADKFSNEGPPAVVSVIAGPRAPQFFNLSYTVLIPENIPEGQPFLTVSALSFQNKSLSYSLIINPSNLFNVHQETGEINMIQSVDYERDQHQYLMLVGVTESQDQLSSAAEVLVVIIDVNDCVPEFMQSIYSKDNVPETVTTATSLLQVSANDCDSGENAEISYFTLTPDFTVSSHGIIFPARQLDYERPYHSYEFVIMAVDRGEVPKTGTATVRIRMTNVNDEAPEFSQAIYRTFVSEDAGPHTLIATVHAIDSDGDGVSYKIVAGNEEGNFVTDYQKGIIRLRSTPPPRLQGTEYVLNITATDDNSSGGLHSLSSTALVIVGVDDVNNNKPIFQKCQYYRDHASVLENQPSETFVLQVEASDADEGANGRVKYGIMHRDGALLGFHIHPDTGILTTALRFDRELQREYPITVTATDQATEPLIGICQMNIQILDENDNDPKFENTRYEYFLKEDTPVGTSFLRVAAHDDDYGINAAITYSMSAEASEYFKVNPVTGWVSVNQPISQRSYITHEIIATDGGNRSTRVELSVTITNVKNQPLHWEKETYEVVIPENTTRDTPIVIIKATSLLGDPRVTYNLEEGLVPETNMPVRFYLMPNREDGSASILVAEPLDFETTRSFVLKVRAQNVAVVPLAAFATVHVNVTDVNDNVPFFTSSIYEASVTEGTEIGTVVIQVSATDLDLGENGKITYSLLNDLNGDHQFFQIEATTGLIYCETVFDREVKRSYLLEVKSTDGSESARPGKHGQPNYDTAYVRIFITDVNDNKPMFSQSVYEVTVDEDQDVNFPVITVSANDEDEGANAKLKYQITSGNIGGMFDVEPEVGTIFISQKLDYEETKQYELHLVASDGKWEDYVTVIVHVINKNDEAPFFSVNEYYGSVTEELDGSPVFVLQVTAVDPDTYADYGTLKYSLHGQGADCEFKIDENTGNIYSQKTLDREERAVWRFVVLATDEGGEGLTGFTDVIINVQDINDNSPIFTCNPDNCHGNVFENSPADTSIMEMIASDRDDTNIGHNAILTYNIIENAKNDINLDLFHINPKTGTIYVALGTLDREKTDKYFLLVEAKDGGGLTGTATATIWVSDINDHAPKFAKPLWKAKISEHSELNSEILIVTATDADTGENAQLTFTIINGDPEQKFYIENHIKGQHGTIKLNKRLDFEKPHERWFNLTIKVEDLDFSSVAHCLIEVEDYNDNSPVFTPHFHHVSPVFENAPIGSTVAKVVATDIDSGLNGKILYSIQSDSDPFGQFTIDQAGYVTVANTLDREIMQQYNLIILARDEGVPSQTGSATVLLTLIDINDNGPTFEVAYMPVVCENVQGPQIVHVNETSLLIYAVDRDTVENGQPFSFALAPEYKNSFDFTLKDNSNNTATVTALRPFDREEQKEYYFPIVITDSGSPPMSATNTLTITIGDENDHPHLAGHKEIYVNNIKGKLAAIMLGKIHAPDPDEWDNKTYIFEGYVPKYFILNQRTGFLLIKGTTPQGTYNFKVRVSDGIWPDAISTVKVHVKELTDEAIYNSGSLRLADITADEFIQKGEDGKSRYDRFKKLLSEIFSAPQSKINIFSVMNTKNRQTDIRFSIYSSLHYRAERLNGNVAAHSKRLQSSLKVNISQIHIDECTRKKCTKNPGCTNYLVVSDLPTAVDTGNISFVSVTVSVKAVCTCSAREQIHQSCTSYPGNPCHNGGTCIDTQNGYRCQCSSEFEGPDCQRTKHTFHGNGYAWFPPFRPCFDSHLSLEFITEVPDGLLLYSGPISDLGAGDKEDFIAIELTDGIPVLKINHGSGTLVLRFPDSVNVADRKWHHLDVRSNGQLGGVKESIPYFYPQLQHKHFTGCLRNLVLDTKKYYNSFPGLAAVKEYSFESGSHILYRLDGLLQGGRTQLQTMIRTRSTNSVIMSIFSRDTEHVTLEVAHGCLGVSYNYGNEDHTVKLASHRIDNGEWHLLTLDHIGREFTLRINRGGGKREVTEMLAQYMEIITNASTLLLGNIHPTSHNSFQGCLKDVRLNNYQVPLDAKSKDLVSVVSSAGVSEGCSSQACENDPCRKPFLCVDLWRMYECRCPSGHLAVENATGKTCVYTLCANQPCHHGICVAQSPQNIICHCQEGYTGRHCEVTLAIYRDDLGLSFTSMFAICVCFLALLGSYGNYIFYYLW